MEELQVLLASDKEHEKVFPNVPIVRLNNAKGLNNNLVRASVPILNNTLGSEPCGKRNGQVCRLIVNTDSFSAKTTDETFEINKGTLNCNLKKVACLSECQK